MKATILVLPLLISSTVNAAAIGRQDENFQKRAVEYVTLTSTTQIPLAQYLAGTTTTAAAAAANVKAAVATPAAAAPAATTAAAASSSSSGGFFGWLSNLFGSDDTSSTAATAVTPASTTAIAYAATLVDSSTAAPVATTTQGYFASLLDDLINPETLTYTYPGGSIETGAVAATSSVNVGYSASVVASGVISATSSSYSSSSSSSGSSDSGEYASNIKYAEEAKGITYSPYNKDDSCKDASTVASDIAKLSAFSLIRLYSTDCSGIENVLASINSNQQLFLGIWNIDSASVQSGLEAIQSALSTSSRGWDAVHTISIGNEQVNAGTATVAQIQTGVSAARTWLKSNAASYSGYVVSVDTLAATVANPGLCDISDYIAVNCHPYFTGSVDPSEAGSWLQSQISSVSSVCGGSKDVLITETGWPTQGDSIGSCVPSIANQAAALESIMSVIGDQAFSFTMYNDYWKDPGPYNIEQYWGIFGDPSS
ncbi:probable family 17 glucosidase Scw10p [[Candida] railenensis]|uniref:Probable family 17 glucosidase Scw10p n=1 Tax=[Candida] railenensis TaxID=45579 RepID=A0A9P0QKZ5_9ASCO|nr:probable family 17 glucosidase Scw10p [[Candida] railenensis]